MVRDVLEFVNGFDHEDGYLRAVVLLEKLVIRGEIRVRRVDVDQVAPSAIVERAARRIVELERLELLGSGCANSASHGSHTQVGGRDIPVLIVVPAHPNDVRKLLVPLAEIPTVGIVPGFAVVSEDVLP